jgi:hypothetical protein
VEVREGGSGKLIRLESTYPFNVFLFREETSAEGENMTVIAFINGFQSEIEGGVWRLVNKLVGRYTKKAVVLLLFLIYFSYQFQYENKLPILSISFVHSLGWSEEKMFVMSKNISRSACG